MELNESLIRCFRGDYYNIRTSGSIYNNESSHPLAFMSIPIKEDTFEIPTLAMQFLEYSYRNKTNAKEIVVAMSNSDRTYYKSLNANIKNTLYYLEKDVKLIKIATDPVKGDYYSSFGAIFDKNFYPLVMCSWVMQVSYEGFDKKFTAVKPILRVDPRVFIDKSNAVERYIINKIVPTALSLTGITHYFYRLPVEAFSSKHSDYYRVKVEIDDCPFRIFKATVPTINTSSEALIKTALDNIDDITLCL